MSTIRPSYPSYQQRGRRLVYGPAPARYPYRWPYPVQVRRVPLRRTPAWTLIPAAAANLALVILPALFMLAVYVMFVLSGRVLPGVRVGQIYAGGQTPEQLAQILAASWDGERTLLLTDGDRSWPVSSGEVGLGIDAQATAANAFEIGRGLGSLGDTLWVLRFGEINVDPVIAFDPLAAEAGLNRLAGEINQPARNAELRLENGQWSAIPGQNGSSLDIHETMRLIALDPAGVLERRYLPVVTRPVIPRINDLTPVIDRLRAAVQQPLVVQAYDPVTDEYIPVPIPPERFAAWVTVEPRGDDFVLDIDPQQLVDYLAEWEPALGEGKTLEPFTPPDDLAERWQTGRPVTVFVRHGPTSYTVQPGDTLTQIAFKVGMPYWKIQQANPHIDPNRLIAGQSLVIPSKNEMLPLPVIPGKRIVISISQQRMWTYENGGLRSEHVISTGIDRSPTIPGIYQVQTHELEAYASVWDLTMPHFMGIYEGWPGFMNGIHGLPTLSNGRRLWEGNLGRPVSYGCIILGLSEAEALYHWADDGVIVEIRP